MKEKNETYRKNIDKRGNVPNSITVSYNTELILKYNNNRKKVINFQ